MPGAVPKAFAELPVKVEVPQVAQLVERRIEIVEYQRQSCQCVRCGVLQAASLPSRSATR